MKRLFLLLTWLIALPIGMLAQGTTWQTASLINSGETVSGTLYHYDNSERNDDWYMIEVPEEGTVELTITPDGTLNIDWIALTWLNGDDVTNDFNSTGVGTNKKVLTTTNVGKGTYYINIHRYLGHGGYTLKYVFTPCPLGNDPEPNDIYYQGDILDSGKTVEGRLGYTDATNYTDDDDWYRIEVPEEGTVTLTINPSQENGLNIDWIALKWLNGDDMTVDLNSIGVGTNKKVLTTNNVGIGTYYINIHRYIGHGGYTLKYKFLANGEVDRIDGDVNGDEEVGVGDLIAVSNYMASGEGSGVTLDDADVNKDGEVGVGDLISISNIMAGIE